jgi:hypothetical protein
MPLYVCHYAWLPCLRHATPLFRQRYYAADAAIDAITPLRHAAYFPLAFDSRISSPIFLSSSFIDTDIA